MARRSRLDTELVRRGLARSRDQATSIIAAGRVRVGGNPASKPATQVEVGAQIVVDPGDEATGETTYVSRGGCKLAGALSVFGPRGLAVDGRRCLDAGASTGGFTDVLLRAGASHVLAVDVGYGQLAWSLRTDPRVTVLERTNVRHLSPDVAGAPAGVVVADLSFISLRLVLPALRGCAHADADYVLLVKPQFEVGKGQVARGGVVREPHKRAGVIRDVAAGAAANGLGVLGVTASPLRGPAGNVEYFLWLRAGGPRLDADAADRIAAEVPMGGTKVELEPGT
ncbi:MAG: TlyA family RNA methyltransferase [Streptosporangiaceae bacterium]